MNIDTTALNTIRAIRAEIDPILVKAPGGSLTVDDDPVSDLVMKERIDTIPGVSNDEPRRVATWGDTAFHLQKSSLQSSIFVRDFRLATSTIFAFERFTEQHDIEVPDTPLSWDQLTTSSDAELDALLQYSETSTADFDETTVMEMLTKIRHALAWEQHQLFLHAVYDELPSELTDGVPKAFWERPDPVLEELESTSSESDSTDQAQAALMDF